MKKVLVLFVVVVVIAIAATSVMAQQQTQKKSLKQTSEEAGKASVYYPVNLVEESAKTVGTAAEGTTNVVVDTVKATGDTLTGKPERAEDIIKTPVVGGAETVKDAAVDTVETPYRAGKKTASQIQ